MTVKEKQLDEKIQTGGGATGVARNVDPIAKNATLPASNLGNGMKMDTIADIRPEDEKHDTDSASNTKPTKTTAGSNKASIGTKGSAATPGQSYSFVPMSVKEDVAAMFSGSDLSEEFKEKATIIFEAAVTAKMNEAVAELEEQYNVALEEEVASIQEDLTSKIDQYMSYVTEQWMEENKVAIEHSLKSEITEDFIAKLKGLFEESYISVPEEQFDIVEGMQSELEETQSRLDQVMEENMTLKGELSESTRTKILASVTEGLAATQAEKLVALSEGVEFDTATNYRKKLEIVKENYFPTEKTSGKQNLFEQLDENAGDKPKTVANSPVNFYADAISRTVKK
jgi:hypothetical protein